MTQANSHYKTTLHPLVSPFAFSFAGSIADVALSYVQPQACLRILSVAGWAEAPTLTLLASGAPAPLFSPIIEITIPHDRAKLLPALARIDLL